MFIGHLHSRVYVKFNPHIIKLKKVVCLSFIIYEFPLNKETDMNIVVGLSLSKLSKYNRKVSPDLHASPSIEIQIMYKRQHKECDTFG